MLDGKQVTRKLVGSKEERAVSPVIGVILMVAITVILAAVIAAFVLELGDDMDDTAPTTSVETSTNSDWDPDGDEEDIVYMSHESGDTMDMEEVTVVIRDNDGAAVARMTPNNDWQDEDTDETWLEVDGDDPTEFDGETEFGGGSTIAVYDDEDSLSHDTEYEVQFIHEPSDHTVTSLEFETPE